MAKKFLARILTIENSINSEASQDCIICQEKCGTLSPETGIMELEVKLPCGHTAGSACIATWLADHNTCPLCRHKFFLGQSRPHELIQEVMQRSRGDQSHLDPHNEGESDEDYVDRLLGDSESDDDPLVLAMRYSRLLNLDFSIILMAASIADTADSLDSLDHHTVVSIAAASTYIASHILREPKSLADIARVTNVSVRIIHSVYRDIHSERYQLIDECWREIFDGESIDEMVESLPNLPWPPLKLLDFSDRASAGEAEERRGENDNNGISSLSGRLELVKELCFKLHRSNELHRGNDDDDYIWVMAQKLAEKMYSMSLDWKTVNPKVIAAACTYAAAQLVFQSKTFEHISTVSGITPASIRTTYEVIYNAREQIVQREWFESFFWSRENAIHCMRLR